MIRSIFAALIIPALVLLAPAHALAQAAPARPSTVTAAIPAPSDRARQWLTLVDDGNYAQSWNEAGAAFKARAKADAWAKQAVALREPLGAVASRDLKSIDLSQTQIAVVRYDSFFAHKIGAVETVTLSFENGGWAVTGYDIK